MSSRYRPLSSRLLRSLGVLPLLSLLSLAACGGAVVGAAPDAGALDSSTAASDAASPQVDSASPQVPDASSLPVLTPTYDGGGMPLSCAPTPGIAVPPGAPFPACTFVDSKACASDGECGCGCSCQCGVCNCNAAGSVGTCGAGACCTTSAECGPACYGMACVGSQCVPADAGASPWIGTWEGTLSWPSTVYSGDCDGGIGTTSATGQTSGPLKLVVTGDGTQLTFLLLSQQGGGQPLCTLPFLAAGDSATLVPGSTCVSLGLANLCTLMGPPDVAIQTFFSGTASLQGGTMTLQTKDVFVETATQGPECGNVPQGLDQVNVEALAATLHRAADGG